MAAYDEFLEQIAEPPVSLPACPLMHGTGVWLGSFAPLLVGGTVVTTSKLGLNPDTLLTMVKDHEVTDLVIVGDAFARPILAALDEAEKRGTPYQIRIPQTDHLQWRDVEPRDQAGLAASSRHGAC